MCFTRIELAVRGEHLRQALVHLRRLVRAAADEHDALLAQARLHRRPVDHAGLQLLLDPDLLEPDSGWSGQTPFFGAHSR